MNMDGDEGKCEQEQMELVLETDLMPGFTVRSTCQQTLFHNVISLPGRLPIKPPPSNHLPLTRKQPDSTTITKKDIPPTHCPS
jgi:hypothetical protein